MRRRKVSLIEYTRFSIEELYDKQLNKTVRERPPHAEIEIEREREREGINILAGGLA